MLLVPGETVTGRDSTYLVERVVGSGAYGAVYSARDPALPGRHVALKEFYPARHPREQASLRALWEREQKVGALAGPHPLMPTHYEAFAQDGHFYIAQEFVEGQTLDDIIRKRFPLPREWTLKWAVSLCDALAFLHSQGVVHHDLKPANIRITPQGHLALLDFGAAQYFGDGAKTKRPVDLYGTDGYLPPELEGENWTADVRTDIFAVGAILYEMLAGEPPDQEQINARSLYVTNTLMNRPNADLGLVKLINRALSYNTEYRYGSANEFLLDMRAIAPPVLLVSKKRLRWGDVYSGQTAPPQTVTLYNAGGGEIRSEIKPRTPWLSVSQPTFRGNRREVEINAQPSKVETRGQVVTGRLEINSADERDSDGRVVSAGDRWFLECSITVLARPGHLSIAGDGLVILTGRRGQTLTGALALVNDGEQPAAFTLEGRGEGQPPLSFAPAAGTLAPGEAVSVSVQCEGQTLSIGTHDLKAAARTAAGQSVPLTLTARVLSPLDFLKSRIGLGVTLTRPGPNARFLWLQ